MKSRASLPMLVCLGLLAAALATGPAPQTLATLESGTPVVLTVGNPAPGPAVQGTVTLILDDNTGDNSIGDAGQFIWINRFTPDPTEFPFQLEEVQVQIGMTGVPLGGALEVVLHEDTDEDGDPGTGSVFRGSFAGTVQANDNATFSTITIDPPVVFSGPGDVLIGVINRYSMEGAGDFPARLDQTATQGRSWAASYLAGDVPAMPTYPADEQWGTIDSFGFPGNWMVRGSGTIVVVGPDDPPFSPEVPTLGRLGLAVLGLLVVAFGLYQLRR